MQVVQDECSRRVPREGESSHPLDPSESLSLLKMIMLG